MSTFNIEVVDETAVTRPARRQSVDPAHFVGHYDDTTFAWKYRVEHVTDDGRTATFTGPLAKAMAWIKSRENFPRAPKKAPLNLHEQTTAPTDHEAAVALARRILKGAS